MMIRLMPQDGECPVELFDKDEAHQLMRERHLAKRNLLIGTVIDLGRETIGTSHDKHKALTAARHASFKPLAEVHRGALAAVLIKQHDMVTALDGGKQRFAFSCLLLCLAHVAGAFYIADVKDIELHIVLQPFHILFYALPDKTDFGFADDSECNLHKPDVLIKIVHKISKTAENTVTLWSRI